MSSCVSAKMNKQGGMILILALILMLLLSLLMLSAIETSLLETKMSNYDSNKMQTFYRAENLLIQYEQKIAQGEKTASAEIIDNDICGITFYRITVAEKRNGASSILQSTFAKIGDITHCDPKPIIQQGRQSWRLLQ